MAALGYWYIILCCCLFCDWKESTMAQWLQEWLELINHSMISGETLLMWPAGWRAQECWTRSRSEELSGNLLWTGTHLSVRNVLLTLRDWVKCFDLSLQFPQKYFRCCHTSHCGVSCLLLFLLPGDGGDFPDGGECGIQCYSARSRQRERQRRPDHLLCQHRALISSILTRPVTPDFVNLRIVHLWVRSEGDLPSSVQMRR